MQHRFTLNRFSSLLTLVMLCSSTLLVSAQSANCSLPAGSGGSLGVGPGNVAPMALSPDPMLTGESSGLSFVQFVFTNPNDLVTDTASGITAPRIIFANNSGQVIPDDLGLDIGDQFCVRSMSFSLDVLQRQIDTLLTSSFGAAACCDFAELIQGVDVCSLLVDAGIASGSDLEDYNDLADFAVAYGIQASLESIFFLIDSTINIVPPGSPCTAGSPMCYAVSNEICFTVDTASAIGTPAWTEDLKLFPNPATAKVHFQFETDRSGMLRLQLIDAQGRQVLERSIQYSQGQNALTLSTEMLVPGMYQVLLDSPEGRESRMLVVE